MTVPSIADVLRGLMLDHMNGKFTLKEALSLAYDEGHEDATALYYDPERHG